MFALKLIVTWQFHSVVCKKKLRCVEFTNTVNPLIPNLFYPNARFIRNKRGGYVISRDSPRVFQIRVDSSKNGCLNM